MAKGFDCATPLTAETAAEFAVDGYSFVGRYLAPEGTRKRLTPDEAQAISAAGLYIVSIFERYASRAGEGAEAGAEDGRIALQHAREVGQPEGTPIYAAVDFDAGTSDFDAIEAYMRAFDAQIPGYELEAYGSFAVIQMLRERGVISPDGGMQTYAWSQGMTVIQPRIYQYKNDITVNGIGVDLDESNGDAGGWKEGMAFQNVEALDKELANEAIAFIKKDYEANDELYKKYKAEGDEERAQACLYQMNYDRSIANGLRRASGQPEEN